jgi:hypothetical protein
METTMSNNVDLVGILEWAERRKKSTYRSEARKPKDHPPGMKDLITLLQERRNENAMIDSFFKDVEKLSKKEEPKKKEWLKLSTEQIQAILLTSFMLTAPVWVWVYLIYLSKHF